MTEPREPLAEFERRWQEWTRREAAIDEDRIRATLPVRLPSRKRRRTRIVLLAAAASLALAVIGVRTSYLWRIPTAAHQFRDTASLVHRLDENVVLFISKDSEPIYIVLADTPAGKGDAR